MALSSISGAYETDQLTDRHLPLADTLAYADVVANEMLAEAVAKTNERLKCDAPLHRTRRVLAKQVHRATSREQWVPSRGLFRAPGYGAYAVWMETSEDVERRDFLRPRTDIYSSLTVFDSFILAIAGTNSTVVLNGTLMGTDKPDHFFDLGWTYLKGSRYGEMPLRAVRRGTATERTIYGLFTSKTFSYADLRANWDGYRFYVRFFEEGSELQIGDDGCVAQVRPFTWKEWASWEWDEVLNPGVHTRVVERGVRRHIDRHSEAYCASYEAWGAQEYPEHLERVLTARNAYVDGAPPQRHDPYQLQERCSAE